MDSSKYSPYNISLHELALLYVNYITDIQPKGPYCLAGWCIGGTIAFEMASILEKRNENIRFLGLFNSIAPQEWNNIRTFTPEGEIDFIRDILGLDSFNIDKDQGYSIEHVWECFLNKADYLNSKQVEET